MHNMELDKHRYCMYCDTAFDFDIRNCPNCLQKTVWVLKKEN